MQVQNIYSREGKAMSNMETPLSLSTVCGGSLEQEFQEQYGALLTKLRDGDKGTLTISLEMRRVKDTATMVELGYKISSKYPTKAKSSVCQIDADGKLLTEEPPKKVANMTLFQGGQA
jgi:hypothetical protein